MSKKLEVTREELKEGRPFIIKERGSYQSKYPTIYNLSQTEEGGSFHVNHGHIYEGQPSPRFYSYECNIEKIGTRSLTVYTFLMGKQCKKKYNFSDLKWFVENDPKRNL